MTTFISQEEKLFDLLLNNIKDAGYGFNQFLYICEHKQRIYIECQDLWQSLINTAKFMVSFGTKTPLEAIVWLIEIAFPIASMIEEPGIFPLPVLRYQALRHRQEEENRRNMLYNQLKLIESQYS